ncbi:hypothetical protein HDV00_000721 [Rhizophlyctis rosea]|nr:hypothetical protein HDV00_000721 [Rhizophlyctis rosea]
MSVTSTTHKALLLSEVTPTNSLPFSLIALPTPTPANGEVLINVIASSVVPYAKDVASGIRPYPLARPLVFGPGCLGRVAQVASDATRVKVGDLVLVDPLVRARDDPDETHILQGLFAGVTPAANALMKDVWRHGCWQEKAIVSLEGVTVFDEGAVRERLGQIERSIWVWTMAVPYGGFVAGKLQPGSVVVVAPSTGHFSSVALRVAFAMGASRVIAVGRREKELLLVADELISNGVCTQDRIGTVVTTGDIDQDSAAIKAATPSQRGADFYLDLSPPAAGNSTHLQSCVLALKTNGTAVLMGGIQGNITLPYGFMMRKNITVKGQYMCQRNDRDNVIRLMESGLLSLKGLEVETVPLEEWESALDKAAAADRSKVVALAPGSM